MREALSGLTLRGRAFLAAGATAIICAIVMGQPQLTRVGILVAALGMLAGFCGTLMSPMAANFNLVPAALLDLKDRSGVIKAQIPTALPLLAFNVALLWWVLA